MNFEVNGQPYVLTFLPDEGSFALFAPNREGMNRMKIVHDEGPTWVVTADPEMEGEGKPSLKN
jgi:hypothetical protein